MRVLVTGGLGFIGSNLIRYMLNKYKDIEIINVDKVGIGSNEKNLKDLERDSRYRFVKGDLFDFGLISSLVKNADAIVNLAAETHVDRSIANPRPFLESNTIGTFNILEAARISNPRVRILHMSTDEVYSEILSGSYREDDRLKPSSPYSASKAAADMFCLAYNRTYNLDVVIARCTNNFGPYQFPEKLIPKTVIRAKLGMKVPIYGTGKNIRDWLYVLDNCEAIDLLLQNGSAGEIYNISAGNELESLTIVKKVLKIMGKGEELIEFVEDRPGHDLRYSLDSTKIRKEIGWRPKHSLEEALKMTVEWYLENESWWRDIVDERVLHPTPWKLRW
uniref:dTDP-glucose 4,6-dehydratase n=1 Tax=Geoglobus ahangari TaxID=113653 RepID=A0A7C4S7R3_9EURY